MLSLQHPQHDHLFLWKIIVFLGSPEGGGVLDNIRGNTGGICAPKALVASRKLLSVLMEVAGTKFPFVVLV